jgi:hypothetical protein
VLTNFLRDNKDIFAWKPNNMLGVPRELAKHRIDVNEGSKPVKQRLRRFSPYKKAAIKKEITKSMTAGFIREILHPGKEHGTMAHVHRLHGSQQTLPKDPFGLPRIDQIVDSMARSALLSFLDCYSGYHQIA